MNDRGAVALALHTAFLVTALVGRIMLHRRRTGDWGLRWQRHDRAARVSGVLFAASLLLGSVGVALVAFSMSAVWGVLDRRGVVGTGGGLFVAGWVLTLVGQSAMGTSWRIGVDPNERTALVADGVFAVVRNPVFTGMVAVASGLALIAPTPLTLCAAVVLLVAVEVQVRVIEEPYLRESLVEWLPFARRVGRFMPWLGRIGS